MKKKANGAVLPLIAASCALAFLACASPPARVSETMRSGDFEYIVFLAGRLKGTVQIRAYTGTSTDLVFPSVIEGKTVSSISPTPSRYANLGLTSVTLPANITQIGAWCFRNNPITRVTFEGDLLSGETSYLAGAFDDPWLARGYVYYKKPGTYENRGGSYYHDGQPLALPAWLSSEGDAYVKKVDGRDFTYNRGLEPGPHSIQAVYQYSVAGRVRGYSEPVTLPCDFEAGTGYVLKARVSGQGVDFFIEPEPPRQGTAGGN